MIDPYVTERQFYLDRLEWTVDDPTYSLGDLQEALFNEVPQKNIVPKIIPGATNADVDVKVASAVVTAGTNADVKIATQHTIDNATYGRLRVFDVKTYGAVGNGTTDDTAAINAAINAAGSNGIVEFPPADYLITSGLTFNENVCPHMSGSARLIYNGTGTAITFYRWSNNAPRNQGSIRVAVYKSAPAWWGADTTSVGVLFDTCYHMTVEIGRAHGFRTGVSLLGNGAVGFGGTSYIDIRLGTLDQNKIGLDSSVLTTGYVSAINLFGGTIRLDEVGQAGSNVGTRYVTGTLGLSTYFGVMLEGGLVEKAIAISSGDNQFIGCSFEGVQAGGVSVTGAGRNTFIGCSGLGSYESPVLADGSGIATVIGAGGARFVNSASPGTVALIASQVAGGAAALQTRSGAVKYVELDNATLNIYRGDSQTYPGISFSPNYAAPGNWGGISFGTGTAPLEATLGWRGGMNGIASTAPLIAGKFMALGVSDGTLSVTPIWTSGVGTPEGVITASIGSLYSRSDGGAGTSLYVKESNGPGATGWIAK